MNQRTLEALMGSIAKWEAIVAGTAGDEGTSNCALCQAFWMNDCYGCPVFEHTGRECCDGTPYDEWGEHDWHSGKKANTPEEKQLAQAMLDFLKSLLPHNLEK